MFSYDIQVTSSAQGVGLGRRLLNELRILCQKYDMKKVMLTVLKGSFLFFAMLWFVETSTNIVAANVKATAFYRGIGYVLVLSARMCCWFIRDSFITDPTSPNYVDSEDEGDDDEEEEEEIVDYEILSKSIWRFFMSTGNFIDFKI